MRRKVPLSDSTGNFHGIPKFQEFRLGYALSEMNYPLAAYVVNDKRLLMLRKLFQGLANRVIHVGLSIPS